MSWERSSALETTQVGVETTPGVRVPALKRLPNVSFALDPNIPVEAYTPQGSMAATGSQHNKEWTEGGLDGKISFYDINYVLAACLCRPVITTPGGATNARLWTYKPRNWGGPDRIHTLTIERGNQQIAESATYGMVNALSMRFNLDDANLTGAILAQEPDYDSRLSTNEVQRVDLDGATGGTFTLEFDGDETGNLAFNITASALQTALEALDSIGPGSVLVTVVSPGIYDVEFIGYLAQQNVGSLVIDDALLTGGGGTAAITTPTAGVAPTDVTSLIGDADMISVYMGDSVGSLARLARVQEVEWGVSDRFAHVFDLQDNEPSASAHVQRAPGLTGQITMQHNADYRELIAAMRAKEKVFWRVYLKGPEIESGFEHFVQITWPSGLRDPRKGSGREQETGQIEAFPMFDSDFGGYAEVKVQTAMTAL
jgi:hypothetical protein